MQIGSSPGKLQLEANIYDFCHYACGTTDTRGFIIAEIERKNMWLPLR